MKKLAALLTLVGLPLFGSIPGAWADVMDTQTVPATKIQGRMLTETQSVMPTKNQVVTLIDTQMDNVTAGHYLGILHYGRYYVAWGQWTRPFWHY